MALSQSTRLRILFGVTSLAVTYVRHNFDDNSKPFEGLLDFAQYWGIHAIALGFFCVITIALISANQKLWVPDEQDRASTPVIGYQILMTALIAAVVLFLGAHWAPVDDFE